MNRAPAIIRAEMTKTVGPGTAYLLTRLYLVDGTIHEQVNPGVPDLDTGWVEIGHEADLPGVPARLVRDGWVVSGAR